MDDGCFITSLWDTTEDGTTLIMTQVGDKILVEQGHGRPAKAGVVTRIEPAPGESDDPDIPPQCRQMVRVYFTWTIAG